MADHSDVQRNWRREPQRGRLRLRRLQIGLATLTLLILTSLLLWASTWLSPPRPARLVLLGAGYQDNLAVPHNVYGWQGLADLAQLTQQSGLFSYWGANLLSLPHGPLEMWSDTAWDKSLADVSERTVVLFFSLHGAADEQGPLLLTADVNGSGQAKHRLRLADVLDRLAKLPSNKQKVLLLDATQMTANWRLGFLANDFAGQLKRLEPRIAAIPNLVVLCASDAGERSWVCDEWRQTIFAHYLMEGLKGAATDLENDGRIDAWELHRFVQANVQGWVQANRAATQTPLLLPAGEEGRRRAAHIDLAVVRRHYQPPAAHAVPEFQLPTELTHAWDRHYQLSQQTPAPSAYSPQTWRLYQDTLLRYEQLLQVGDQNAAARLNSRLQELTARIERARTLELASLCNTLTMPATAGYHSTLPEDAVQRAATDLWNAPPQDAPRTWLAALTRLAPDDMARQLLRLRTCDWLLERAAEDPDTHLASAVRLLGTINDPLRPRPIEAHYAVMLERDKPTGSPSSEYSELLRLSLSVRRLAEQAALAFHAGSHPYSEFLWDTISPHIELADEHRRAGEDLLLASPHEWPQARQELEASRSTYLVALNTGREIQTALQVRDYVLSMLPYYSQCVAYRLDSEVVSQQRHDELVDQLLRAWQETHALCEQLDKLRPDNPQSQGLAEQADRVRRSYDEARSQLCRWWQELSAVESPAVWHEADAALLVPHRDPQLRMKLLENKRRTSRRLFIDTSRQAWRKTQRTPVAHAPGSPPYSVRQQGVLALAVLGQRWFDACGGPGRESYEQVRHRLDVLEVESHWQDSLAKGGEQISLRWRELPATIEKLVADSRNAPREESQRLLERADRLARQIDALGAQSLTVDPVAACRRLRMQDLLAWQAERTLADRWYGEDPQATPYFQLAGGRWLSDAQQLGPHVQAVAALREHYKDAQPLAISGSERLQLTTQLRQEVVYHLDGGKQAAAGYPVIWVEPVVGLDVQFPEPGQRQVRQVAADRPAALITCTLASPQLTQAEAEPPRTPAVERTALQVCGLFRGQQLAISTPVALHLAAETSVAMLPLPERGSIAVRADARLHEAFGQARGAVTILLDCSGSMGPPRGENFSRTTKFVEATTALKQVLSRLPRGTTVSVWVFGQAMGSPKTVDPPERTIRRIQDPIVWEGDNAAQLAQVMARLEYPALEPWNESPLVRAMLAAKEDLADRAGYRTLLVLTDGMDNRFERAAGEKADIAAALRTAFQGSGIVVNIVGFKVVSQEAEHAQRQFSTVETLDPPGKFVTVAEAERLAEVMDVALRQRLQYGIENYDRTPLAAMPASGLDISQPGGNDQWFPGGLKPGSYRVRASAISSTSGLRLDARQHPSSADVAINRGDLLLLKLSEAAGQLTFSRLDWSREDFPWKPHVENPSWRLSLMQSQRTPAGDLRMLVALEKLPAGGETVLQHIQPREAWLEVEPRNVTARPITRWRYLPGFPAAAWNVDVPAWPQATDGVSPARPRVRLWFNADQETPAASTLRRHHDFTALADLAGRPVRVLGDEVRIESVKVERHVVQTRAGAREPQSCLVVRLSHLPEKPVWATIAGVHAVGQEHRYYSSIGAYTGLFWPVTPDEAELALARISLISLEEFKLQAQRRGCVLSLDDLPPPSPNDFPPRAALELP